MSADSSVGRHIGFPGMSTIMISCGEPSGDLYGGALATEIRRLDPGAHVFGLGGERLREAGADLVGDYPGLTVTGLVEALRVLPRSLDMYRRLVRAARDRRPDVLVAIDFPDFNFRLAAAIRRLGIPVVYYVPPQLWAWRRGRVRTIRRLVERALVIFPFEEQLYREAGVPVDFVGHPLLDLAKAEEPRAQFLSRLGLRPELSTVALLPGSRPNELARMVPVLAKAAALVSARLGDTQFVVARAPNLDAGLFSPFDAGAGFPLAIVESRADDVLAAADVAITASGTATVQAAIHLCPMVVVYRLAPLTYHLGRRFVHVDTFGMVNLVAGHKIVPELIQDAFTPEAVAAEALRLLTDRERAEATRAELGRVVSALGAPGASRRAAGIVLRIARREGPEPKGL
jgi:lipid-A-disaccharide synthase